MADVILFPDTADFGGAFDDFAMEAMEEAAQSRARCQQRRCALAALARDRSALQRMAKDAPETFKEFAASVRAFKAFIEAQPDLANSAYARVELVAMQEARHG